MAFITIDEVRELLVTISNKQFSTKAIDGFDKREVDEFLDSINDQLQLVLDYMEAVEQEKANAKAAQPIPATAPVAAPAPRPVPSGSVEEVLTLAVQLKNNIIAEAQSKADRLMQEAELQAKARLGDLAEEEKQLKASVEALKKTAADYRASFEQLLAAQQSALDNASDLFE